MDIPDYVTAAYLISAVLLIGLALTTWLGARRVKRALTRYDTPR